MPLLSRLLWGWSLALAIPLLHYADPPERDTPPPVELPAAVPALPAAQTRVYRVQVAGQNVGEYRQVLTPRGPHLEVACSSRWELKVLLTRYAYDYQGQETWRRTPQGWRLLQLEDRCHDNGQFHQNRAEAGPLQIALTSTAGAGVAPLESWTTSYWCLPDAAARRQPLTVLSLADGRIATARLALVGPETRAGRACEHYRLSGELQADLWFETATGLLVRREMVRRGRPAVLELVGVR